MTVHLIESRRPVGHEDRLVDVVRNYGDSALNKVFSVHGIHNQRAAADQGSITVKPAVLNALVSRDATANSCAAAIAAM